MNNPNILKKLYKAAKEAKISEIIICPSCNTKHIKTHYNTVFCKSNIKTVCKDYYWNNVTETKRCNTTRISPANAAFIEKQRDERAENNFDDDMGWDAHKDSF